MMESGWESAHLLLVRVFRFSLSVSLPLPLLTPRYVLLSRPFSIAHWFADVDSRDCVMHMQLHLASEYASPIIAVKLDCRRLSTTDRPNKTGIFSTNARSLLFAFFSKIVFFFTFLPPRNRLESFLRKDSSIEHQERINRDVFKGPVLAPS